MRNSNDTIWNRTSDLPICITAQIRRLKLFFTGDDVDTRNITAV